MSLSRGGCLPDSILVMRAMSVPSAFQGVSAVQKQRLTFGLSRSTALRISCASSTSPSFCAFSQASLYLFCLPEKIYGSNSSREMSMPSISPMRSICAGQAQHKWLPCWDIRKSSSSITISAPVFASSAIWFAMWRRNFLSSGQLVWGRASPVTSTMGKKADVSKACSTWSKTTPWPIVSVHIPTSNPSDLK